MTRNKVGSENVRKITRVGSMSYSITIPVEYMRKLKWQEKQEVVVTQRGKKLVIEDWEA